MFAKKRKPTSICVIGHRGAAGLEPENTLRSIRKAMDLGVDRVEVDVRVSKDGHLIIIHDETVDRTTNGHGYVKDLRLTQLRRLDAGIGERIPTLIEVFGLVKGRVILQVELKVKDAAEPLVRLVEGLDVVKDVIITSFMHDQLEKIHTLNADIGSGALFKKVKYDTCDIALSVHSDAIHVRFQDVDARLVEEAHKKRLKVVVWNPDEAKDMVRMMDLGVDAIGTNRPDILLNLLSYRSTDRNRLVPQSGERMQRNNNLTLDRRI